MSTKAPELNRTSIHDAATAEILKFASEAAGLVFDASAGREWIISQVFEALEWDAYKPEEGATHVLVKLNSTATDSSPYQGGFNGRTFTIKRDYAVELSIGQYNTMIEQAARRFELEAVRKDGRIEEGSPAKRRLPLGGLDLQVIRFLQKGGVAPAAKPAPAKAATTKTEE